FLVTTLCVLPSTAYARNVTELPGAKKLAIAPSPVIVFAATKTAPPFAEGNETVVSAEATGTIATAAIAASASVIRFMALTLLVLDRAGELHVERAARPVVVAGESQRPFGAAELARPADDL